MTTRARTRRRIARVLVRGLGGARLLQGTAEVLAPRRFLGVLGTAETPAPVHLGFRMKGGRDVALGLLTARARSDDARLADLALAAVVVDGVDGLAVALDRGRTLGPPVDPWGGVLGAAVAVAALWASRALRP